MAEDTERVQMIFECEGTSAAWTVQTARLREQLNAPYRLMLTLATDDETAEPVQMLGQLAALTLIRGAMMRQVTGLIGEVQEGSTHPEMVTTAIVVVPALEALRHRINTRIFQEKTVPEILEEVLAENLEPYARAVVLRLDRAYLTCDYRVQYNESDLTFCHRLMEEEGIIYWFELDGEAETLVLADAPDKFGEITSLHDSLLGYSEYEGNVEGQEYVSSLHLMSQLLPTKIATQHFDWTAPTAPIEGESTETTGNVEPNGASLEPAREVYQHDEKPLTREPGGTTYGNDKEDQVELRRQEQAWESRLAQGTSTVTGMKVGAVFDLVGHPRLDLDGKYLVTAATHHFDSDGRRYRNAFQCIPAGVVYRPPRLTPKPRVPSIQTATVVGPSGEEIHTDEHGRVKVQFHWDRLGSNDDKSSCWVRIQQPWAGAGWGFVFIPRMGMEVVVDFVNGDPDRPMVVGSVYNGDHPPPYPLPDEKTKSTIKTNSSLGGEGFNELRFEDMAGEEEIFTHAQKDQNEVVENDHTVTVHHDETTVVDNNQTQDVGNDQTEHVGNNQDLEVDANRTIAVHGDFEETIDGSETRTVTGQVSETFSASETRSVSGDVSETLSSSRTQQIGGDSSETINGSLTQTINGGAAITTPGAVTLTANGEVNITAPAGSQITANGGYTVISGSSSSHDQFWDRVAQGALEVFADYTTTCVTKIEVVALAMVGLFGVAFEKRGFHMEITPINAKGFIVNEIRKNLKASANGTEVEKNGITADNG